MNSMDEDFFAYVKKHIKGDVKAVFYVLAFLALVGYIDRYLPTITPPSGEFVGIAAVALYFWLTSDKKWYK